MFVSAASSLSGSYEIANSLRFDGTNDYLTRTFGTPTTQNTFTFSAWVKRSKLGALQNIFGVSTNNSIGFPAADTLVVTLAGTATITTTAVYRDPAAWYHIVYKQTTGAAYLYVNGSQVGTSATVSAVFNTAVAHQIGAANTAAYTDGYLSEINFIDGQALDASYFGYTDATTGQWRPKKYTGTYGTNGFYLDFKDGSSTTTLGYDRSGNGNNWTLTNMVRSAGVTDCWMTDTPTNNFCTWNPLQTAANSVVAAATLSGGNLTWSDSSDGVGKQTRSTWRITSGKWYAELEVENGNGSRSFQISGGDNVSGDIVNYNVHSGQIYVNGVLTTTVAGALYATISMELDADAKTCAIYKDGVLQYTATGLSGSVYSFATYMNCSSTTSYCYANFGQRSWYREPNTGYKALCTANLPTPTGAAAKPSDHFRAITDTGANIKSAVEAIYADQALMIVKDRANANNWQWFDDVRGLTAILQSNTTAAETTYTAPSGSSIGYALKAASSAVTNTAGTITSQVSANTTAGFSIVTWTEPASGTYTIGHGLGVAPALVIEKQRSGGVASWAIWHKSLSASQYLQFTTGAASTSSTIWNNTTPTSSVLNGTAGNAINVSQTAVAYCFAEVPGFSKIGSYTGNGNADGPFVWCGFKPRYIMFKRTDTAGYSWCIYDTARDTNNNGDNLLVVADSSAAESTATSRILDFTSNGFKVRGLDAGINANGATYIFMAFAEAPFQYANAR